MARVRSRIGSLHTDEVYRKFEAAGANFLILSILYSGVPLFFHSLDIPKFPRGRDCNNRSANAQSAFVSATLADWEAKNFIERVDEKTAKCVLPLSVADRWSHTRDTLKYRLGKRGSFSG